MALALVRLAVALLALRLTPWMRARTGRPPLGAAGGPTSGFGLDTFGAASFGSTTPSQPDPLLPLIVSRSGQHHPVHRRRL